MCEMMNRHLIISLLCCLIAIPACSTSTSGRGLPVPRPNLGLRGGSEGAVGTANNVEGASGVEVGSSEGVEQLKTVLEAACDPSQTSEQKEASKASILEMVSDRWGQLPKEKQDDLKKFALQQLGQAAGMPKVEEAAESKEVWDMSMKLALGVSTKLVPQWGGLLGRMQNLVSDVVSAETSQSKAERIMRETMELAWTKAAGAKVTIQEVKLPQGADKTMNISGFEIHNPSGSPDFDDEEVAVSIDILSIEPAVDILQILGGDVIVVEKVSLSGVVCHLQMANFSNFFRSGRPMSNLQVIHEHLTLFHDAKGLGKKGQAGGNPLSGLVNLIGNALKMPKGSEDARIAVRKVQVSGVTFTCGAQFMDGRFRVRIPDAEILDVGEEAKGGIHPTRIGEAIWGAVMRDLLKRVNLFNFAQTHELGKEISASVKSLLFDVKGGAEAVRNRMSSALSQAADAIREKMHRENSQKDEQKEARERFYGEEEAWSESEERRKEVHDNYDPNYPPEVEPGQLAKELQSGGVSDLDQIVLDFEKSLDLKKS